MGCPRCGSENGVLVAYGVDGEGEWESCECEECARVWMERGNAMLVNGYEVGAEPTKEEMAAFMKVRWFLLREWVANTLANGSRQDGTSFDELYQDEFDELCNRFYDLDWSADELQALEYEYERMDEERS